MLYDPFGRPIRKPHFFGFGRVPQSEPARIRIDPRYSESGCADAIGSADFATEEADEAEEILEIKCKKATPCENSSRR